MNPSEEKCRYCGGQATQFLFAQHVCDKEDCINKAREERGGPGGHMLHKESHIDGPTIEAMDFDDVDDLD
jgi:hypothetical protein